MTRGIASATLTELEADTARPIVFVELQLTSGTERLHSGVGDLAWGGNTWTGAGDFAALDELNETADLSPDVVRMGLSGVSSDMTDLAFTEDYYRRPVLIYVGAFSSAWALVADPSLIFSGFIQNIDVSMGDTEGDSIVLTAESELLNFERPRTVRYTNNELQTRYSGDLGLEFIDQVPDAKTVWRGTGNVRLGSAGSLYAGIKITVPY